MCHSVPWQSVVFIKGNRNSLCSIPRERYRFSFPTPPFLQVHLGIVRTIKAGRSQYQLVPECFADAGLHGLSAIQLKILHETKISSRLIMRSRFVFALMVTDRPYIRVPR
jgi:hypothetical protein